MRQYLDTSALIALGDKKDRNHDVAKAYLESAVDRGVRFVVGKNVLVEYIDGITKRIGKGTGIEELDNILNSRLVLVERDRDEDWSKTLEYFRKYSDARIDLTDCISFSIMERLKMDTAFTFDSDFRIRFTVVP